MERKRRTYTRTCSSATFSIFCCSFLDFPHLEWILFLKFLSRLLSSLIAMFINFLFFFFLDTTRWRWCGNLFTREQSPDAVSIDAAITILIDNHRQSLVPKEIDLGQINFPLLPNTRHSHLDVLHFAECDWKVSCVVLYRTKIPNSNI